MAITVNGVEITDQDIERELPYHSSAMVPIKAAVEALILREIMLQAARKKLGTVCKDYVTATNTETEKDALIERLIEREVITPAPLEQECERYYRNNSHRFLRGTIVEVGHILFQVTSALAMDALRAKAEAILEELLLHPEQFEAFARAYSNCPSGEQGGNLGQLSQGQTVPEFERAIFSLKSGQVANRLIETRFGLHIVRVQRRFNGQKAPFELVRERIAAYLTERARERAIKQYLNLLIDQSDIQGTEMEGANTPLVH